MAYDSWTCLMVEKGPGMLDDDVRTALKKAACHLQYKRWDRMHIESDVCGGLIETAWKTHVVGSRPGVLFRAQIEGEEEDYFVNFLLSVDDLERGAHVLREEEREGNVWADSSTSFPCEDLYRFENLRKSAQKH